MKVIAIPAEVRVHRVWSDLRHWAAWPRKGGWVVGFATALIGMVWAGGACGGRTDPQPPFAGLVETVRTHVDTLPFADGVWPGDYGDAPFYGLAYSVREATRAGQVDLSGRAAAAYAHALDQMRQAQTDTIFLLDNLEGLFMGALGVIEYIDATGRRDDLPTLDAFLDRAEDLMRKSFKNYIKASIDSYALNTYGPTTISAVVALIQLRYAELVGGPRKEDRVAYAREVMATVDREAYTGNFYRFDLKTERLDLYPNVMMCIAWALLHIVTGDIDAKARAEHLYQAVQPLRDAEKGNYKSLYSAEYMGAKTDDYSTLSSQNYVLMAWGLLFRITGHARYRTDIEAVMGFIEKRLLQNGRLIHHWMDGRQAIPEDPEYYCTGCNFQFVFVARHVAKWVYGVGS